MIGVVKFLIILELSVPIIGTTLIFLSTDESTQYTYIFKIEINWDSEFLTFPKICSQ